MSWPRKELGLVTPLMLGLLLLSLTLSCSRERVPAVYLSDMRPTAASQGYGNLGIDRSVAGNPIWIDKIKFAHGLGTHAPSSITFPIHGMYTEFAAEVGIDAEVNNSEAKVSFRVMGDGRTLYDGPVIQGVQKAISIRVNVKSIKELTLVVLDGGNGIKYDHADWGDPRLYQ